MIHKLLMVFTTIKPIGALAVALLAFFAPIASIVHGVLVLVALDLISGIAASFKRNELKFCLWKAECWKYITSQGLGMTISKLLVYLMLIIVGFIIDTLIIPNAGLMITKIMAGAVGLRELKSLVENSESILGAGIITFIKAVAKHGFTGAMDVMLKSKNKDEHTIEDCKMCEHKHTCSKSKLRNDN